MTRERGIQTGGESYIAPYDVEGLVGDDQDLVTELKKIQEELKKQQEEEEKNKKALVKRKSNTPPNVRLVEPILGAKESKGAGTPKDSTKDTQVKSEVLAAGDVDFISDASYYLALGFKDYKTKRPTQEDIRKHYRRLARKYHPDLNPNDKLAENRFKQISEAYDILSDPSKRQVYDRTSEQQANPVNKLIVSKVVDSLRYDALEGFKKLLKGYNFKEGELELVIKTPEVKNRFIEILCSKIRYDCKNSAVACKKLIDDWKAVGVDLNYLLFESGQIHGEIFENAVAHVQFHGGETPNSLLDYIASWKKELKVNISSFWKAKRIQNFIIGHAYAKIKFHGKTPSAFLTFVANYKPTGLEVLEVVNFPESNEELTHQALNELKFHKERAFISFVDRWREAGWKTPPKINQLYKQYS